MAGPVSRVIAIALLPLMLVVAFTTDGAQRAWLELAGFVTLLFLLYRRA